MTNEKHKVKIYLPDDGEEEIRMLHNKTQVTNNALRQKGNRNEEQGAALVTVIIIMALLAAISMSVLAVVSTEANIAGSDLMRAQTFYAAAAGIEKMSSDFSSLFNRTSRPTDAQIDDIEAAPPSELATEGFEFTQFLIRRPGSTTRTVIVPDGPFKDLNATVVPYQLQATARHTRTGTEVSLQRDINNYLIPIFQFGMFSDGDLELHPGADFFFNGRVHANGNIYANGLTKFLDKVTTANEFVFDVLRNGEPRSGTTNTDFIINGTTVNVTTGSVIKDSNNAGSYPGGPRLQQPRADGRGNFPTAAWGLNNNNWNTESVRAVAANTDNRFGGYLLTRGTGAKKLQLPMQIGGSETREIIKRMIPGEEAIDPVLRESRYHFKAQIRVLIDDETTTDTAGAAAADASGIPANKGVKLSEFFPLPLNGGKALMRINSTGTAYATPDDTKAWQQQTGSGTSSTYEAALTVRGVRPSTETFNPTSLPTGLPSDYIPSGVAMPTGVTSWTIPGGAGIKGRILIEIVRPNGTTLDVTKEILSMGMTEGEPNGIVYLQRPLWANYMQGSRDRAGANLSLTDWINNSRWATDGEINATTTSSYTFHADGFLTNSGTAANSTRDDDDSADANVSNTAKPPRRAYAPSGINGIVPINLYNVREGRINTGLDANTVFERGVTSIVEVNMKNLARWVDGHYDGNLLSGTNAVSANIEGSDGYILYVSDRRGDRVRTVGGVSATNGIADNLDIYGPNDTLDDGEDVVGGGTIGGALVAGAAAPMGKDITEILNPSGNTIGAGGNAAERKARADTVAGRNEFRTIGGVQSSKYFRRAVRLFNGEDMLLGGGTGKLSNTKGITVASENMMYVWGNYNTTGIASKPSNGATLNNGGYNGDQIPASIVADAFFPLSRTWFDASSALYPDDQNKRDADSGSTTAAFSTQTSMRMGVIAGNNLSALTGSPDAGNSSAGESRLNGGMHNFPRLLEDWGGRQLNLVGAFIPLYRSTQAVGPYNANSTIYGAPQRNWAFDETFTQADRLPPGTPLFQYIEPTGFRQVL